MQDLEIGYETVFQYFWRDREPIMDLIELTSGNRVYASLMTVGGVRRDIKDTDIPKIKSVLKTTPRTNCLSTDKSTKTNQVLRLRMKDVGILSREDALKLSVVGPVARGFRR